MDEREKYRAARELCQSLAENVSAVGTRVFHLWMAHLRSIDNTIRSGAASPTASPGDEPDNEPDNGASYEPTIPLTPPTEQPRDSQTEFQVSRHLSAFSEGVLREILDHADSMESFADVPSSTVEDVPMGTAADEQTSTPGEVQSFAAREAVVSRHQDRPVVVTDEPGDEAPARLASVSVPVQPPAHRNRAPTSDSQFEVDLHTTNMKGHPRLTKMKKKMVRRKSMQKTRDLVVRVADGDGPLTLRQFREKMTNTVSTLVSAMSTVDSIQIEYEGAVNKRPKCTLITEKTPLLSEANLVHSPRYVSPSLGWCQ